MPPFSQELVLVLCSKCGKEAPRYRHWSRVCRDCHRADDHAKYLCLKDDPKWVADNRAKARAYYVANRASILLYWRQRNKDFPELNTNKVKRWRQENPLAFRAQGALRKARTARATIQDGVDYLEIMIRDRLCCQLCGLDISSRDELSFDHRIALANGGEHSTANIQLAHLTCNIRKGAK